MLNHKRLEDGRYSIDVEGEVFIVTPDYPIFVMRMGAITGTTVGFLMQSDEYYHMNKPK